MLGLTRRWGDDEEETGRSSNFEAGESSSPGDKEVYKDAGGKEDDRGVHSYESEEAEEEEDEEEEEGYIVKKAPFEESEVADTGVCGCKSFENTQSCLKYMDYLEKLYVPDFESTGCIVDNIIRCYNFIFHNDKKLCGVNRVAFADLFYRVRHEILFKLCCLTFGLPAKKSDRPFSEFGIKSNRTPDLIIERGGVVLVIEVTVTSSFEKALLNKGADLYGVESKYKGELEQFRDSGRASVYCPIFFDTSDVNHSMNIELFNNVAAFFTQDKSYRGLLNWFSKELSILTGNFKKSLILPSAIVFSKVSAMRANHDAFSFLYKTSIFPAPCNVYRPLTIASPVYSKVMNSWSRIIGMLENGRFKDDEKLLIVIPSSGHKLEFRNDRFGESVSILLGYLYRRDVISFLKFVIVRVGNSFVSSTDSETGIKFFELTKTGSTDLVLKEEHISIPLIMNHNAQTFDGDYDITYYTEKCRRHETNNLHSIHYDPHYEDDYIKFISEIDRAELYSTGGLPVPNLLGYQCTDALDIDEVFNNLRHDYTINNKMTEAMPLKVLKMKSPFIHPIADLNSTSYCELSKKNFNFIERVIASISQDNPFTAIILQNVKKDTYSMYLRETPTSSTYNDLVAKRSSISNSINQLYRAALKKGYQSFKMKDLNDEDITPEFVKKSSELKSVLKSIKDRIKVEKISRTPCYIRLATKSKNSALADFYKAEMCHFRVKKVQSTIEGVGIRTSVENDYREDFKVYNDLCGTLLENRGTNPNKIIDFYVDEDAELLFDLKSKTIESYRPFLEVIMNSCLGHAASFISNLGHSLMYYSQLPFSSDYIRVDNLGYKNCLLIVKGGKKIFKTKCSKFFRVIYPLSPSVISWYTKGHQNQGSFKILNIDGVTYGLTPWATLHESVLTDSISFYHRICSFVCLNLNPNVTLKSQFHKLSLNVILSFHNRRQTEIMLSNLRYILLSTLGDFTGFQEILKEFFGFNYDCFQSFIRSSILLNYPNYFKHLDELKKVKVQKQITINDFQNLGLKNIFTSGLITNIEDLAIMIYSTFLMSKAPYQRVAERAINLKGILKIHQQFEREVGLKANPEEQLAKISVTIENNSTQDYVKNLFDCDFNIDPKFIAIMGNYINSVLVSQGDAEDLETEWINILSEPWDEMATSTGLRGDYKSAQDFWGKKGYFVIYKELISQENYLNQLKDIFSLPIEDDHKKRLLQQLNETFDHKINKNDAEFLIFHAVDKVQWKGSREIYVMDLNTKLLQQPIEKYMGFLCKKLDNELISIPSDRRSQVIHHAIFEKDLPLKEMLTWYLTLDCSKWAPKSVFVKFVIFILNISCIPNSFKTHFLNYLSKLYNKRIYFNEKEVEAVKNNPAFTEVCNKYLIKDNLNNGYYMIMPYSWVMGIFNYTSSFMHAANQKYASYLLMKSSILHCREECSLVMFAHSDDSGGRLCVTDKTMAQRAIVLYEIFLKTSNHLLSKKKSVVSRIYFEVLSIIYMFKQLLALLPKFLGGLRFLPTDKGAAEDMLQSYSKCIEVMVAGGDFSIAYLVMKIYSHLIWRFYYSKEPSLTDYRRPVQYLGMPDSHPLFTLLCGSDCDLLRLMSKENELKTLMCFSNAMYPNPQGEGPIKCLPFNIQIRGIKDSFESVSSQFKEILESWSIRNVQYNNTAMNLLSFVCKLNNSGFVGSLVNESTTRRISRSYYMRNGASVSTRLGLIKLKQALDSFTLIQGFSSTDNAIKMLLFDLLPEHEITKITSEIEESRASIDTSVKLLKKTLQSPLKIYKYLRMLRLRDKDIVDAYRTLKPTQVQLVKTAKVFSVNFDPATLVSYIKEPDYRWAIKNSYNLISAERDISALLCEIGLEPKLVSPDLLLRVARTYGKENTKSIFLYSKVPGEIRQIKTYAAFLTFLSVNSFKGKEIQGLTLKLTDRDLGKDYAPCNLPEEVYEMNNCISLLYVLLSKCGLALVSNITLNPIPSIDWFGGSTLEFINHVESMKDTDVRYGLLQPQLLGLKAALTGNEYLGVSIQNTAYYTFLKSQKMRSGWYGKGEVYIRVENSYYSFELMNETVTQIHSNMLGQLPQHHSEYITDVMNFLNLKLSDFPQVKYKDFLKNVFGFDSSGHLSISPGREIIRGVGFNLLTERGGFVDQLSSYKVRDLSNDSIILEPLDEISEKVLRKLHVLPIKRADLVPTIKSLLDPKSFQDYVITNGMGSFEEFILTEILTEYGKDIYIDFEVMLDNFVGSQLYKIFKYVSDNDCSKISRKLEFNFLPASQGSLVRILIDYSNHSSEYILKTPTELDPTIMQLRSEYPEQTVALLGEKLQEYYHSIYDKGEKKEITDSYSALITSQDSESTRAHFIKLMTYWGYGSLTNSLENFTLVKDKVNYVYFNFNNLSKDVDTASSLFLIVVNSVNKAIISNKNLFSGITTECPILDYALNPTYLVNSFVLNVIVSLYQYRNVEINCSLNKAIYFNVLQELLKNEDFCADLQSNMAENYLLGCIPINYQYRLEITTLINTLSYFWLSKNKQNCALDYTLEVQKLPDNISHPKSFLKSFQTMNPVKLTTYFGQISPQIYSYIQSKNEVNTSSASHRLSIKLMKYSSTEVPANSIIKFERPLTDDFLESECFDELLSELTMSELDEDTINELWSEATDQYKSSTTRMMSRGNVIRATISWVFDPDFSCKFDKKSYLRQLGENIVLMTATASSFFIDCFPNAGCRLVNFSKVLKNERQSYYMYYSFCPLLSNPEFINKFLGGVEYNFYSKDHEILKSDWVRDNNGAHLRSCLQGSSIDLIEALKDKSSLKEIDGCIQVVSEKDEIEDASGVIKTVSFTEEQIKENSALELLRTLESEGKLSHESLSLLREKYLNKQRNKILNIRALMSSILRESELMCINKEISEGEVDLTPEDQRKMFLAPEHFSLGRSLSKTEIQPIKDKKVRSEINSFHSSLSQLIGSNTLTMSKKIKKVITANLKLWSRVVRSSKFKVEGKTHALMLFTSICNNSFLGEDTTHDPIWNEIIGKVTVYIAEEGPDEDEEDLFSSSLKALPGSRLTYMPFGSQFNI